LLGPEGTSQHGRMGSRRLTTTITVLALLALAVTGLFSAAADAGSLLSGYGGPGQGNQAILGSALINGPSGKGGSGSGSGPGSTAAQLAAGSGSLAASSTSASSASTEAQPATHSGKPDVGASGTARSAAGKNARKGAGKASGNESGTYTHSSGLTRAKGGSQALGLSGADLGYILLALGVLAFTGVLTRKLARQPVSG
jgi:hypothetical protein